MGIEAWTAINNYSGFMNRCEQLALQCKTVWNTTMVWHIIFFSEWYIFRDCCYDRVYGPDPEPLMYTNSGESHGRDSVCTEFYFIFDILVAFFHKFFGPTQRGY